MPLQATSGAASYDAFGGGVPVVPAYIEEVFSCFLYTGTGNSVTQRIASGIDLATKGGMVWVKNRTEVTDHQIYDTARGQRKYIRSNTTDAEFDSGANQVQYKTSGWDAFEYTNELNKVMASWTFRKAPKFFDVVTFTKSSSPQTISHSLGSTPGCIFIKRTDSTGGWLVAHRGYSGGITAGYTLLNTTAAFTSDANAVTAADSTSFALGSSVVSGDFVAYLFAHDAGGFGLTGTDNVISCGTFDANLGEVINLGYEPQWLLYKDSSSVSNWRIADTMRGLTNLSGTNAYTIQQLSPNTSSAESENSGPVLTSTGFTWNQSGGGNKHIYIAIRRGPMKVPTDATKVYNAITGTFSAGDSLSVGFPADMYIDAWRTGTLYKANYSRLVNFANSNSSASQNYLKTNTTDAEITTSQAPSLYNLWNTTANVGSWNAGVSEVWWMFRRAPSFFDEVCYTGTGSARTVTHNLGAVPELMIVKARNNNATWAVYAAPLGATKYVQLENNDPSGTLSAFWNDTAPTSTVFTLGTASAINGATIQGVAYLFATCAGVSKVGSYTGTGTTKQIDCGFTGGARFVLIRRTDSTGDWYVWDTARGIVSGNDSYLLLNSTAAEVTSTDYIDTYSAGFEISSTAPSAINASGGTFIFLAIA
jgi:hypothetical protein